MDGLNFLGKWISREGHWIYKQSASKINRFVQGVRKNYDLVVFFDWSRNSEETLNKWFTRREADFKKQKCEMPTEFSYFVQKIFIQNNVKVYNCLEDGDDVIANWAFHNKGIVLSQDKDYYRYESQDQKYNFYDGNPEFYPYKVSDSYQYNKNTEQYDFFIRSENMNFTIERKNNNILIEKLGNVDKNKIKKIEIRQLNSKKSVKVVQNKTKLELNLSAAQKAKANKEEYLEYNGCGSELIKRYGNPHYILKPLIAQLYAKKGIDFPIKNMYIIPDPQDPQTSTWVTENIYPDKNDNWINNIKESAEKLKLFQEVPLNIPEEQQLQIIKHNYNIQIILNSILYELQDDIQKYSKNVDQVIIDINTKEKLKEIKEQEKKLNKQQNNN